MFPFSFWPSAVEQKELREQTSPMWKHLNETFVAVLGWSWLIYVVSALVIFVCGYFAYCERRRQMESTRRLRGIQRAQERPPQKRRPNAAYRDHQIYRHIILSVAKYMKNPEGIRPFIEQMDQLQSLRPSVSEREQQVDELSMHMHIAPSRSS
ncbi:uncharacterized protein LOC111074760 [Drosophila obscura]|uniref:uncharacterized protein LOC111074760 n=1 Tax=Drosophila obscura TaxID=7282 RepID=UPI000BA04344|nr:uncharacterized protein LOC111074760 [Drosophila obscura]